MPPEGVSLTPSQSVLKLRCWTVVAMIGYLATVALAYLSWLIGYDCWAWKVVAPLRYLLDHQPGWPLVTAVGVLTTLLLFLEPIHRFLAQLRKGPLGTETHSPTSTEKTPLTRVEG